MAYIEFKNVCLEYYTNKIKTKVLKKVNFEIEKGELVAIIGSKNAGKTTLLNILSGIVKLTSGEVLVDGLLISNLSGHKLTKFRRKNVSFSLEDDTMIKNLTVQENVELGSDLCDDPLDVNVMLKKLNLLKKKDDFYSTLSLSEQKKVTILRSLAKNVSIFLADEITKSLDSDDKSKVLKLLKLLCKKQKKTIIITSDNDDITTVADRVIKLKNGNILEVVINKKPKTTGGKKC